MLHFDRKLENPIYEYARYVIVVIVLGKDCRDNRDLRWAQKSKIDDYFLLVTSLTLP